jgi:hypothetical protein
LAEKFALATRQYPESAAGLAISEKFGIDPQKRLALGCATEKRVVKNGLSVSLVVGFGFHDAIDGIIVLPFALLSLAACCLH